MAYYLSESGENQADWKAKADTFVSHSEEIEEAPNGQLIRLTHTIRLTTSAKNNNIEHPKYVFVVENAYTEPKNDYPENDRYTCEVFVLAFRNKEWKKENLDFIEESQYEGDTRFAKDCSGFSVKWKNNYPILTRSISFGPYEGGEIVDTHEEIFRANGKYQLKTRE